MYMLDNHIVTIDGPSGVGKTTVARRVADALGLPVVNSGRLFRVAAWALASKGIRLGDQDAVEKTLLSLDINMTQSGDVTFEGEIVTGLIDGPDVGMQASVIAKYAGVRQQIVGTLRQLGEQHGCVIEGRTTGDDIFPQAILKIWLTASLGKRRQWVTERHSLKAAETILVRDQEDMHRALAPMQPPKGAVEIDATHMTVDSVVDRIIELYRQKINEVRSRG